MCLSREIFAWSAAGDRGFLLDHDDDDDGLDKHLLMPGQGCERQDRVAEKFLFKRG